MLKIMLCGCNGRMGRAVTACVAERLDCSIVAGIDINTESRAGFPVYANPANCPLAADVIIDFFHPGGVKDIPDGLPGILAFAREHGTPIVIATTGLSPAQIDSIRAAAADIPVFFSTNMSVGINLMLELCRKAAAILGVDFDIEVVEKHHNTKLDAPSGTALMLADALREGLEYEPNYVYDRSPVRRIRDKKEIGFSSVRGGNIVGEHEVIFAGHDEVMTITHSARSKEIFAVGAVAAALFLHGKEPGFYTMNDMILAAT